MNWKTCLPLLLLLIAPGLKAQDEGVKPVGAWARLEIDNGDSVFVMSLRSVRIIARRNFKDLQEQRQYYLYLYAARKVYPYAVQAMDLYSDLQEETGDMNHRQRKRRARSEQKALQDQFEGEMKNLSKTEGKVLIKMLERELNEPFYDVIKETRGGFTAVYWHQLGKIWGYNLKDGYQLGADPLLDEVLHGYDLKHPEWAN